MGQLLSLADYRPAPPRRQSQPPVPAGSQRRIVAIDDDGWTTYDDGSRERMAMWWKYGRHRQMLRRSNGVPGG